MGLSVGDKTVSEFTVGNTPIKQGADEGNLFRGKNKKTFSYTGSEQSFTVPVDGYYILECRGAQGGSSSGRATRAGGNGGYAKGKVYLTAGTVLKIYVGEKGKDNTGGLTDVAFNGGGKGGYSNYKSSNDRNGGGGGGTDIRIGGNTLYHRLIVAGGGAGGHAYSDYTSVIYGGGENGGVGGGDRGGTQTGGGEFGVGGSSSSNGEGNRWCMNGGGGGWYGGMGQATSSSDSWRADFVSGGGSGFVWTGQDTVPSGYLVSENYILDETENIAGNESMPNHDGTGTMVGNIGNGCVVITYYLGNKGEKVTEAGIYHNPDLGLISMSADGENRVTISDKNAEAWSDDIEDELSYGGYFQFGNIHGFGALPEPVPPEPPEPTPRREPGENTLLYMPLNGDVLDYSGNNNNGIITGTIEQIAIGIGDRKYAYFNNDSAIGLVSVPVGTGNVESHTFCCWAKVSPNGVCCPFFMGTDSNGQRYSLVFNYGTNSFQHIMDVYGSPDVPLSSSMGSKQYVDQWVHVVYTYDKSTSTHTLYLNTVQSGSSNLRGLNIGNNNKFIGRAQSENGYGLSEIIFEQGIWTQQQIDDHFNLTKSAYGIN